MSTHNLCFKANIRKIGIPLHTPEFSYIYTIGVQGGTHYTHICFPDALLKGKVESAYLRHFTVHTKLMQSDIKRNGVINMYM